MRKQAHLLRCCSLVLCQQQPRQYHPKHSRHGLAFALTITEAAALARSSQVWTAGSQSCQCNCYGLLQRRSFQCERRRASFRRAQWRTIGRCVGEQDCVLLYHSRSLLLEATRRRSSKRCARLVERGALRQNSDLRISSHVFTVEVRGPGPENLVLHHSAKAGAHPALLPSCHCANSSPGLAHHTLTARSGIRAHDH